MSIKTPEELEGMKAAGRIVRKMLSAMREAARSGITTAELDHIGGEVMREHGARSAPALVYGFPGVSCISVNEEIVHGIPGQRKLRDGDLLKLDVTIEKDGYMADAAETVIVGNASQLGQRLAACAERAFHAALPAARAGGVQRQIRVGRTTPLPRVGAVRQKVAHRLVPAEKSREMQRRPAVAGLEPRE